MKLYLRYGLIIALAGALVITTTGCFFSIFQVATTLPQGAFMFMGGLSALEAFNSLYTTQQLHARYGISELLDIGVRAGTFKLMPDGDFQPMGFILDAKYQLTSQPALALGAGFGTVRPPGALGTVFVLEGSAYGSFQTGPLMPYAVFRAGLNLSNMEIDRQLALGTAYELGDLSSLWLEVTFVGDLVAVGGALSITLGK